MCQCFAGMCRLHRHGFRFKYFQFCVTSRSLFAVSALRDKVLTSAPLASEVTGQVGGEDADLMTEAVAGFGAVVW
jgi:hypothetical protein